MFRDNTLWNIINSMQYTLEHRTVLLKYDLARDLRCDKSANGIG